MKIKEESARIQPQTSPSPSGSIIVRPTRRQLFLSFLRLGLTAFGGPAVVAYMQRMVVERKKWLTRKDFEKGVALCQTIPGATTIQMSAYIGLTTGGVRGAVLSFAGFGMSAFLLMLALSIAYQYTHDLSIVASAFTGLQAIIIAIIASSTYQFGRTTLKDWRGVAIASLAFVLFGMAINPLITIAASAILGFLLYFREKFPSVSKAKPKKRGNLRIILYILIFTGLVLGILFIFSGRLFQLALLMFRIDLFAFGGGFTALPLMLHEVVTVRSWLDATTFMDGIALGQITPGPIVITSTFIGYMLEGIPGAIVATIFIFLPSFLLVVAIEPYYLRLSHSVYFQRIIRGVFCSFVGLLLSVLVRFSVELAWDIPKVLLALAALIALLLNVDILWVILVGIVISILIF
jgi:chromate transporter